MSFTKIDNTALAKMNRLQLPSTTKAVYIQICKYAYGTKNTCYPTEDRLAAELRVNRRTVVRAVKELTESGFIRVEKHNNRNNVYTINNIKKRKIKGYRKVGK